MNLFNMYLEKLIKTDKRMPGFILAKQAAVKNEKIGIITARSNKESHLKLINRLEKSLGIKLNYSDIHFINDKGYFGNSTAEKKLNVIKSYAEKYKKIRFYDDEFKNVSIVNNLGFKNVKAYDIKNFKFNKDLNINLYNSKRNIIHLFDLDGTVWKLPAFIKIMKNGKLIKEITQEQFAENAYKLKENEYYDFSDFSDENKLNQHSKLKGIFNESVKTSEIINIIITLYDKMIQKNEKNKDSYRKSNYNPLETLLKVLNNYFYEKASENKFKIIYNRLDKSGINKSSVAKYIIPLIDINKKNNIINTLNQIINGFNNILK